MTKLNVRLILISIILILVTSIVFSVSTFALNLNIKERKIVVFNDDVSNIQQEKILNKHGAEKLKDLTKINAKVISISKNSNLKDEDKIKYIEDDIILSISKHPKTKTPKATPLATPTQPSQIIPWGIDYMEVQQYWDSTNIDSVKVGIVDTGISLNHPDLVDNVKGGFNTINNNKSANDDNGHGTFVAGIVAAANNEIGVVGMVPDVDLYAIKVLDSNGNGYLSDIIEGIEWAINNDMNFLNLSFGNGNNSESLHEIIIKAYDSGITMVAAAGNNYGRYSDYPAAYPEVMSIGAINKDGDVAVFSATTGVDIFAPGVEIYSTYKDGLYTNMDGTSFASPHVCGKLILSTRF